MKLTLLITILSVIIAILLVVVVYLVKRISTLENEKFLDSYSNLVNKNRVSMIEYHYRDYKEGENPFTTLRNIGDVLKMSDYEVGDEICGKFQDRM